MMWLPRYRATTKLICSSALTHSLPEMIDNLLIPAQLQLYRLEQVRHGLAEPQRRERSPLQY